MGLINGLITSATGIGIAGLLSAAALRRSRALMVDRRPKTVLVTGSANGLGRATAELLMRRGDFVVGTDIDEKGLASLKETFPALFLGIKMDVSNAESVATAVSDVQKFFSRTECLDAIVNNAGLFRGGPLVELPDKDMAAVMNVNVIGTFLVTKHFFPTLRRSDADEYKPRIVNFASEVSLVRMSAAMMGPYAMSKFAIEAYSTALRQELAIVNPPVHVVTVNPGPHASNMTEKTGEHFGPQAFKAQRKYYSKALLDTMEAHAQSYMDKFVHPASELSDRIWQLVHATHPPTRAPISVSGQMQASRFLPQGFLDYATVNFLRKLNKRD